MKILPTFLSRLACSNLASSTVLLMLVLTSTSVSHTLTFKGFRVCIEASYGTHSLQQYRNTNKSVSKSLDSSKIELYALDDSVYASVKRAC